MCTESGQSKTFAVEKALTVYIDAFDAQQRLLKTLNRNPENEKTKQ